MKVNLDRQTQEIVEARQQLSEKLEAVIDREAEALEKAQKLDKRESAITSAESENKHSTDELAKKWLEFHKDVEMTNTSLRIRERDIANGKSVNESYAAELTKKAREQVEKDRELVDRYATLQRATEEFLRKQNKHGNRT